MNGSRGCAFLKMVKHAHTPACLFFFFFVYIIFGREEKKMGSGVVPTCFLDVSGSCANLDSFVTN